MQELQCDFDFVGFGWILAYFIYILPHWPLQAETDRISSEIQKKKEREGREVEQEKMKKMVTYFFHDILDWVELSLCV